MQTSSPPVITPNRSQSNPDDVITLPRPIQSVGMNLHNVSGTSTGQTLPRERRAPRGTHFCPTKGWVYPLCPLPLNKFTYCTGRGTIDVGELSDTMFLCYLLRKSEKGMIQVRLRTSFLFLAYVGNLAA